MENKQEYANSVSNNTTSQRHTKFQDPKCCISKEMFEQKYFDWKE